MPLVQCRGPKIAAQIFSPTRSWKETFMNRSGRFLVVLAVAASLAGVGCNRLRARDQLNKGVQSYRSAQYDSAIEHRSEEHTSELQSLRHLVCRLLLEKTKS